jgi:hypothetical protein
MNGLGDCNYPHHPAGTPVLSGFILGNPRIKPPLLGAEAIMDNNQGLNQAQLTSLVQLGAEFGHIR